MGDPALLDVYLVKVRWGRAQDARPVLVVRRCPDGRVGCALISSARDLFEPRIDRWIEETHVDFSSTGLIRSSYVSSRDVLLLSKERLVRKLGSLQGVLREEIALWWSLRTGFDLS